MVIALSSATATEEPIDRDAALVQGLTDIRAQYQVPSDFPAEVLAEADQSAVRPISGHADWTDRAFVTLDPAASTDLDQAFAIERDGADLILHYAIADVAWFVAADGALDREAWRRGDDDLSARRQGEPVPRRAQRRRGEPASRTSIGPRSCSPSGSTPRASLRWTGRCGRSSGRAPSSRTKRVRPDDLPADFSELSRRIEQAEDARGAARVDEPEQLLSRDAAGHFTLEFRPQLEAEIQNASLSLAANLAIADALLAHRTGLFRVMPEPDERSIWRLRHSAKALGLVWPKAMPLKTFEQSLDAATRATPRSRPTSAALGPRHPTRHTRPAASRGIRQWRRPTPMRRRRCGGWPTAM